MMTCDNWDEVGDGDAGKILDEWLFRLCCFLFNSKSRVTFVPLCPKFQLPLDNPLANLYNTLKKRVSF